ncbi:hypothetical protein D2T29_19770 [Sinirhodobacter populi]|uniref:HTH iclR-type domain-containing protein n=1 Tax=Paenirhodobacter populi TaxID=2306993 RepID=A0A443K227_9RHOB|nr:hypothetical protein [Sinirhodobacter populi]RWR26818.1 hypothetical protein D2T29_19770 [Sinirhodobacter populi]
MTRRAGSKPADVARDNRQAVWDALRETGSQWRTILGLSDQLRIARKTVDDYLIGLAAAGYVERRNLDDRYQTVEVRLIRDLGYHAPRVRKDGTPVTQGAGVTNMWRSMRLLGTFNIIDISAHSTTPSVSVALETAQSYCSILLATGYLRVVTKADPVKGRRAVYRLIRDDGPKAPMIQRVKQVYDPNTGAVYRKAGQE